METNILNLHLFTILYLTLCCFNMNWSHRKWHNSVIMSSSDLEQVSKFSLVQCLKLFLWHSKDLVSRKNVLKSQRKRTFFWTPFTGTGILLKISDPNKEEVNFMNNRAYELVISIYNSRTITSQSNFSNYRKDYHNLPPAN